MGSAIVRAPKYRVAQNLAANAFFVGNPMGIRGAAAVNMFFFATNAALLASLNIQVRKTVDGVGQAWQTVADVLGCTLVGAANPTTSDMSVGGVWVGLTPLAASPLLPVIPWDEMRVGGQCGAAIVTGFHVELEVIHNTEQLSRLTDHLQITS